MARAGRYQEGRRGWRSGLAVLLAAGACLAMRAQQPAVQTPVVSESEIPTFTIEQATARVGRDFAPAYERRKVRITGQVAERPYWDSDGWLAAIRDEEDFGMLLRGGMAVEQLEPGDTVDVTGEIVRFRGMPVLAVSVVTRGEKGEAPGSRPVTIADGFGFRSLGLPVEIEGRVTEVDRDGATETLVVTDGGSKVRVVLHKRRRDDETKLRQLRAGDRIRAHGLVTQDAALPPFDRYFQLTLPAPDRIVLVESSGMIPAYLLLSAASGIALLAIVWWVRDQRRRTFRSTMKGLNGLGEEVLAASSMGEIARKVNAEVPEAMRVSRASIYLYDRKTKSLNRALPGPGKGIGAAAAGAAEPIAIDKPGSALRNVIALSFRNGHPMAIPDTRRSDLFKTEREDAPRSVLAVPMFAQGEILGVLVLEHESRLRYFHHEEQVSAQHLGNQIAASIKALEQRSFREQLFKSEKLAATGQLIAGVVNDLRSPVEAVLTLSQLLLFRGGKGEERELRLLAAEAQRTAEIVARLISFGRSDDVAAKPVDVNGMLRDLLHFREREWKSLSIQLTDRMSRDAAVVIGAQGQLEQVFLNILLYAERAVSETGSKQISLETSTLGRRVLVDVAFPMAEGTGDPFVVEDEGGAGGLSVLRGIVQSHGGEIQFDPVPGVAAGRICVELPRAAETAGSSGGGMVRTRLQDDSGPLTAVIVEPDAASQRTLVALLAQRGHRAIPVGSPEEALDLAQRVKCHLVICASRMPSAFQWMPFYEKIRAHTDEFVLLMDGSERGHSFAPGDGHVLRKPVNEADVDRVLGELNGGAERPVAQHFPAGI